MSQTEPEHDAPELEIERLRGENAELRRRVELAETAIAQLREEALARRAEVRAMAEALPAEISRRTLLRTMVTEAVHHPDKAGVVRRGVRKIGRAPAKAVRIVVRRD
jgi:septal ring factor EnvC (AmiA/AmiB activator)